MEAEENKILKANDAFYEAFENLDLKKMEAVWLHEGYVQCIHPGWGLIRGWGAVMSSWKRIFENTQEIHFMLTEVKTEIQDKLAWVTLCENITSQVGEEVVSGIVIATNLFEKRGEEWLLILHHGSTVSQPSVQPNPSTFH